MAEEQAAHGEIPRRQACAREDDGVLQRERPRKPVLGRRGVAACVRGEASSSASTRSPAVALSKAVPRRRGRSPAHTAREIGEADRLLQPFLAYLATERGLAGNTLEAYRRDLTDVAVFLAARGQSLSTASAADFHSYLQSQSRRGKSTRTVSRRLAAIRAYGKYLSAEGRDRDGVLERLERPKPERSLPTVLSRAQVERLLDAPDPTHPLRDRDVAMLELLYASGLRASELCTLTLRDVNLSVGAVRVFGKGRKERVVPMGEAARAALSRYLADCRPRLLSKLSAPTDHVFLSHTGKPLERVALWQIVRRAAQRSGLLREVHPHVLRHCFASHLVEGGADLRVVQELLGHADVSTTQVYTHVDTRRLKHVHGRFHPRA